MDSLTQAKNLIEESKEILIVPAQPVHGDSLASALALFFTLKKLGKNANVSIEKLPEKFQFLTELSPALSKDFVISINGSEKEISQMRYEKNENGLKIYLALNKGEISAQDISFANLGQNPDLLIVVGGKQIENLSHNNAKVLSINNQPADEGFDGVSLSEINKPLAEISLGLISSLSNNQNLIDKNIATCLLTGIISASQNFRDAQTKPQTLAISASLIKKGADHQKIVQHLYKQKSISQVRILGKILEKLSFNQGKELYSATLSERDFQECNARPKDLGYAVGELKLNFRYLSNLLILWEGHASPIIIKGLIYSSQPNLTEKILENYQGVARGEGVLFIVENSDLSSAQEQILKII